MRTLLVVVAVVVLSGPARADVAGNVRTAFTAFVNDVAKQQPGKLELFIAPKLEDSAAVPASLAATAAMVPRPVVKIVAQVVSPGGKSAWVAAEIKAKVPRKGKPKDESLRASAFLVLDGTTWRVTAAHWSASVPNQRHQMCGMMDYEWQLTPAVPKALAPAVKPLLASLEGDDVKSTFPPMLSDDKRAMAFGSGPGEKFVGGAKIKGLFKKWEISLLGDSDASELPARAGIAPDGELMWVVAGVSSDMVLCTMYRTLFVLAKEKAGWRVVHHHYSEPLDK